MKQKEKSQNAKIYHLEFRIDKVRQSLLKNKRIKANAFFAICFFAVFTILALRCTNILFSSYLWAEDGPVFLSEGLRTPWKSMISPYAGYLHLIPRICTALSILFSRLAGFGIQIVPQLMQLSALLIGTFCITYICSERYVWIMEKQLYRMLTAIVLAACAGSQCTEIWYNITNLQWWCGLLIFWICMDCVYKKAFPDSYFVMCILILIGLSTPLGGITVLVFGGLLIYQLVIQEKIRNTDILRFLLILFPSILQGLLSVIEGRTQNSSIERALLYSLQTLSGTVPSILYTKLFQKAYISGEVQNRIYMICIGILIWGILSVIFIWNKRGMLMGYILFYCELCLFLAFFTNDESEAIFWAQAGGRYLALPQWGFLVAVCIALHDLIQRAVWSVSGVVITALVVACGLGFSLKISCDYEGIYSSASFLYQPDGKQVCQIWISPGCPWEVSMPFDLAFMEERITDKVIFSDNSVNGMTVSEGLEEDVIMGNTVVDISGWIVDEGCESDPAAVLLRCGNSYFAAAIEDSDDVDLAFGNKKRYQRSRYRIIVPVEILSETGYEYEIIAILQNKTEYCRIKRKIDILDKQIEE